MPCCCRTARKSFASTPSTRGFRAIAAFGIHATVSLQRGTSCAIASFRIYATVSFGGGCKRALGGVFYIERSMLKDIIDAEDC